MRGRGLPAATGDRGNLYVVTQITIPKKLSDAERAHLATARCADECIIGVFGVGSTSRHRFFKRDRMKISLGSDHAGFRYKEKIKELLIALGHEVKDFGTTSEEPVDYPKFIRPAAEAVASGECDRGIVLGGSGNGEAMAANKVRGVRCALCWNEETARLSRQHNDANVLSLGERMIPEDLALKIVRVWLTTDFEGGRHIARIAQLDL